MNKLFEPVFFLEEGMNKKKIIKICVTLRVSISNF